MTARTARTDASLAIALVGALFVPRPATAQCAVVSDLIPGATGSSPTLLATGFGRELYFTYSDPALGRELWRWDPVGGVTLVADVNPGLNNSNPSGATAACLAIGPRVFFDAFVQGSGSELWMSDGTPGNAVKVKEINPGSGGSSPREFVECDNRVFFAADDGTNGSELWVSDGTSGGTFLVADIRTGSGGSQPSDLVALDGKIVFTAFTPAAGRELWVSDGTPGGTIMIGDLDGGSTWTTGFGNHVRFGDEIFVPATTAPHGNELWKTDGTIAGTVLVADIVPGPGSSSPLWLTPCGDLLFFAANGPLSGNELWAHDRTAGTTYQVLDVRPGPQSSQPKNLTSSGDRLFFGATSDTTLIGEELWVSDGTSGGTALVEDINPGGFSGAPNEIVSVGANVCFYANDANGFELWFSDGTAAGTFMICDLVPGAGSGTPQELTVVAGQLVFKANDPVLGNELFALPTPGAEVELLGQPGLPDRPTLGTRDAAAPVLGTTIDIVATGPAGHLGFLFFGPPALPLPPLAPFLQGGCDWAGILSGTGVTPVSTASPSLTLPLPISNIPSLEGAIVHLQMAWLAPGGTPPLQLSNGLQLVLGPAQAH